MRHLALHRELSFGIVLRRTCVKIWISAREKLVTFSWNTAPAGRSACLHWPSASEVLYLGLLEGSNNSRWIGSSIDHQPRRAVSTYSSSQVQTPVLKTDHRSLAEEKGVAEERFKMVCYCLDLRGDSKLSKFLGNKLVSVIAGIVQLIIWVIGLFNLIFPSGHLKETVEQNSAAVMAIAIVLILFNIAFSVLLLIGLFKDYPGFMKVYLFANVMMTSLFIISFFLNLFMQPHKFGVSGFLSMIIMILLNVLFFFIIRNYYLAFISTKQPHYLGSV